MVPKRFFALISIRPRRRKILPIQMDERLIVAGDKTLQDVLRADFFANRPPIGPIMRPNRHIAGYRPP